MSQSQGTSLDAAADIRALVHAQASAWAAGDAEAIAGAFSDPCEFIVPGMRLTHPHEIQRAAEDHRARYRDVRVEVERIISQDDSAAVEWTWTDTDKKTGATARVQDAIVLRVAGGKLIYWREYVDCTAEHSGDTAPPGAADRTGAR
ncbi:MAG: nuclear transport factor 2 family protein [Chloroflexi bacterium]|nr:nuclear transport factor 2 family protein [Chloroflexota bacterium]